MAKKTFLGNPALQFLSSAAPAQREEAARPGPPGGPAGRLPGRSPVCGDEDPAPAAGAAAQPL